MIFFWRILYLYTSHIIHTIYTAFCFPFRPVHGSGRDTWYVPKKKTRIPFVSPFPTWIKRRLHFVKMCIFGKKRQYNWSFTVHESSGGYIFLVHIILVNLICSIHNIHRIFLSFPTSTWIKRWNMICTPTKIYIEFFFPFPTGTWTKRRFIIRIHRIFCMGRKGGKKCDKYLLLWYVLYIEFFWVRIIHLFDRYYKPPLGPCTGRKG